MDRGAFKAQLEESLPVLETAADDESRMRACLRALLDPSPDLAVEAHVAGCANCGSPVPSPRSPYCGSRCRETAALVRRVRAAIDDLSALDPEKQVMLGQALWALCGGGYPLRLKLVGDNVVRKVIARDGGVCAVCGAPATQVEHNDAAIARGSG